MVESKIDLSLSDTDRSFLGLREKWILVKEEKAGVFMVVDDSMTVKNGNSLFENTALSFCHWDEQVEDLDNGKSDESQCLGMSRHLRWNDVDLTPRRYTAPNINRLKEALTHVSICAWRPGEI